MIWKDEGNKMEEKKPKSTILVLATMLFLAMFIALPPLFRVMYPKNEESSEIENKKTHILSCETISFAENIKIISKTLYEDDIAIRNTISYTLYTPTPEELAESVDAIAPDMTAAQAITYFKTIEDINVNENSNQTSVVITREIIENNPDKVELTNYLLENDLQVSYFEGQGFVCSKLEI